MVIGSLPVMMRRRLVMPGCLMMMRSGASLATLTTDLLVELVTVCFRRRHAAGMTCRNVLFVGSASCAHHNPPLDTCATPKVPAFRKPPEDAAVTIVDPERARITSQPELFRRPSSRLHRLVGTSYHVFINTTRY